MTEIELLRKIADAAKDAWDNGRLTREDVELKNLLTDYIDKEGVLSKAWDILEESLAESNSEIKLGKINVKIESNKISRKQAFNREVCDYIYDSLMKLDGSDVDKVSYITKKYDLTLRKEETGDIDNIHILISPRWGSSK